MPRAKAQGRSRGQIIPKGDGRWLVRFFAGRDANGKRKYPAKLVEGTFLQAQKELTKLQHATDAGTFVAPLKMTLKEYLEQWLAGKVNLSAKTRRDYEARMKGDVYPVLGSVKLEHVSTPQIQWCVAAMIDRQLSPRTIEYTHTILSQAFEHGVRTGTLAKNPARYVELPKKPDTEQTIFSPAEASLFLEKSSRSLWYPLWLTLLTTGMRPQEALALEWSHVDLELGIVAVRQALVEVKPGIYEVGPVKTKKGKRAIGIPDVTTAVLKEHRKTLGAIAGFVFPNHSGSHYDLSRVRKAWYAELKRINADLLEAGLPLLPVPKLYGARHTHLTHLLMANVHPKATSGRAGHSSTAITMEVYSHVLPEVDREAGNKIGALLFPKQAQG